MNISHKKIQAPNDLTFELSKQVKTKAESSIDKEQDCKRSQPIKRNHLPSFQTQAAHKQPMLVE